MQCCWTNLLRQTPSVGPPGVNFINILQVVLHVQILKAQKDIEVVSFFALLGSARVKVLQFYKILRYKDINLIL